MKLIVTGHRLNRLGYDKHTQCRLEALATAALVKYKPSMVLSGMALGWDQAVADAAIRLAIPVAAYLPFEDFGNNWPESSRAKLAELLKECEPIVVSPGGYSPKKLFRRNLEMLKNGDTILALWSGAPGGTEHMIKAATARGLRIINLWQSWIKYK